MPPPAAVPPEGEPLGPVTTGAAYAALLLVVAVLAVWGAFLVPLRAGTVPVPLALVLAALQLPLGLLGGRLLGRPGAAGTGLLWLGIAVVLATRRAEGDLVVPSSAVGLGFLLVGAVTGAVAFGRAAARPGPPAADAGRPVRPTARTQARG